MAQHNRENLVIWRLISRATRYGRYQSAGGINWLFSDRLMKWLWKRSNSRSRSCCATISSWSSQILWGHIESEWGWWRRIIRTPCSTLRWCFEWTDGFTLIRPHYLDLYPRLLNTAMESLFVKFRNFVIMGRHSNLAYETLETQSTIMFVTNMIVDKLVNSNVTNWAIRVSLTILS